MGEVAKRLQQQIRAWALANAGVIRVTPREEPAPPSKVNTGNK